VTIAQPGSFRTPRMSHARVSDAMHPGVMSCLPETRLREVARVMAMHHVHCVVVSHPAERGRKPSWGILSGLDLVAALATDDAEDLTAGTCPAPEPITVSADEPLGRAVQLMAEHRVAHIIAVAPASGRPAGVLSTLDIAGLAAWGEA
jgi:CBS domain-containing protein